MAELVKVAELMNPRKPPEVAVGGGGVEYLLLENGDPLLLENGDPIKLETSA